MTVHVRRATARDIKEILPVWGELAVHHAGLDPAFTPSVDWPHEYGAYLRTLIGRDDALAVIARDGDELVGYAVGRITHLPPFFEHRRRGYIHDVYVRMPHRHRGIGRRLINEILAWCARQGVTVVELTVAANNQEGESFWRKLGFKTYMLQMKKPLDGGRL